MMAMPVPATTTVAAPAAMEVATTLPNLQHDGVVSVTSNGGEHARQAEGSGSDLSASLDDYSDTGSSGSDDEDDSDEESLADRHARKRTASSPDQSHPAKRRRSSSDSGGAGADSSGRKRRNLFPAIRRGQRCGSCHTCLNPQLKKACITVRERMMKEMQGSSKRSSKAAASAAPQQQQQQQSLSPANSGDLDQDKYVDMLEPLIDRSGGLTGASAVGPFIQVMGNFKTTLSRILPTSVLSLSKPSVLSDFMAAGGVDLLASWMLEAEGEDSDNAKTLLVDVLQLLQKLPVTKAFVSATKSAKVIGSLRKHRDPDIQQLAQQVVKLWMRVIPGKSSGSSGSSVKAGSSAAKPAGGSTSASASAAGSLQGVTAKKTVQGSAGVNGAAGRHLISDNDLFRPAAAAKPKASLRLGMGQPKRSGGVQLVDTAEAGKLLTGSAAGASAAAGRPSGKLLPSQRPRLPSPPLGSTGALPSAASSAAARVSVDLQVTPEQTITVTLRVIQPSGRLPGLRRIGFGSSLGGRQMAAAAVPGAVQAAVTGAAWGATAAAGAESAAAAEKKPRKPKKRVSWKSERELESVRWFVKDDPAVKAREDAHLSDEQLRALAAQRLHHHSDFHNLIMMEHQNEKIALEAHHREEEERRHQAVAAMQPGCPWHGIPPPLQLSEDWQVALGEDSTEARQPQRPLHEILHMLAYAERVQPEEGPELLQPRPSTFNMAHHDPNVKLIPLYGAQQQQQQQPPPQPVVVSAPPVQEPYAGAPQTINLQQPGPPQQPAQQQATVTYTLGRGMSTQPQLVMQPVQQPAVSQPPPPQQQPQQVAPPAVSGPPSSADNSQLMQALASLAQSGLSSLLQQQQQQQQQPTAQPVVSQVQVQQQPPPQQLQQPPPAAPPTGLAPASGIPPGHQLVSYNGMQVLIPPGTALPAGAVPIGPPAPVSQLPPGYQLPPQGPQAPPPGLGLPPGPLLYGPPGQPGIMPPMVPPGPGPEGDFGPGSGTWAGPPPGGPYGRGPGRGDGAGGPQRHGRGGRGGRGGPYHMDGHGGGRGGAGSAPWQGNARVCKFFNSTRGCSKGDKCDFRHLVPGSDLDVREQGV